MDSLIFNETTSIFSLPMLYKQTKTGKTQTWEVFLTPARSSTSFLLQTTYGQLGGKMQTSSVEIEKGKNIGKKNETTPKTQGISEMVSKWTRQQERLGYGVKPPLPPVGGRFQTNPTSPASPASPSEGAQGGKSPASPASQEKEREGFKGNRRFPFPSPMLLHEYNANKDKYINWDNAYMQEKIDGVRVLASICPETGKVILMSRQKKEFTSSNLDHIREELAGLSFFKDAPPGTRFLDGELYSTELNFNQIVSQAKGNTKEAKASKLEKGAKRSSNSETGVKVVEKIGRDLKGTVGSLSFWIFDTFDLGNLNSPFSERYSLLESVFERESSLVLVTAQKVTSDLEVQAEFEELVACGCEGAVIRDGRAGYLVGQRSRSALKLKPQDDSEFLITGFTCGKGKDAGAIIFTLRVPPLNDGPDGTFTGEAKYFSARPAVDYATRTEWYSRGQSFVGRLGTVKYMGLTPDGVPRFPVFKGLCP